jgi:hypothetical protein
VPGRPVALVDVLNALFGLGLADAEAARRWLADGGWPALDAWISSRRGDRDAEEAQPDTAATEENPE